MEEEPLLAVLADDALQCHGNLPHDVVHRLPRFVRPDRFIDDIRKRVVGQAKHERRHSPATGGAPVAGASSGGPSGGRAGRPKNSTVRFAAEKSRSPITPKISLRRSAAIHSRAARPNGIGWIPRDLRSRWG